jgi:protein-tyrosine phosphatase
MAEQMLRAKLVALGVDGVKISSAGTHALVDSDMPPQAREVLSTHGYEPTQHASVQVSSGLLEKADLVLVATEDHRADVVREFIPANRYSYTIKEFANQLAFVNDPGEVELPDVATRAQSMALIASTRGLAPVLSTVDLEDPYGKDITAYEVAQHELEASLDLVTNWLVQHG